MSIICLMYAYVYVVQQKADEFKYIWQLDFPMKY